MTDSTSLLSQLWFKAMRYLSVIAFVPMSWAVGRRLTRRLSYGSELEAAFISTALGWGAFGLAFFCWRRLICGFTKTMVAADC